MIVVDIETSGADFEKCGIIEIGAVELENPKNFFLEEARLGDDNKIINATNLVDARPVLEVIGRTEEQLRDKANQSEKGLLINFFKWCRGCKIKNFICHNPQFDYGFIWTKANEYGLEVPFYHKCFDLHTLAQQAYFQSKGEFLIKKDDSDMGLKNILEFVGMKDERKAHNALEDAKLTAECFSRLVYGKNLLPEYAVFKIPDCLIKK